MPPQDDSIGFNFFPLQTGQFRAYQVEQIDFSLITSDTSSFQLREVVVDSFLNAESDYTFILHREIRQNDSEEWELDSVWSTRRTSALAVVTENNIPIIKLVFPVEDGVRWDSNGFSSKDEQLFRYENSFTPFDLEDTTFNRTVTVIESDLEDNLIMQDERIQVYAEGVGLVHRDYIILNFCAREDCLGEGIIESGRVQRYDLIDHGIL